MLRTYKSCFECELREAKNIHATVQNDFWHSRERDPKNVENGVVYA